MQFSTQIEILLGALAFTATMLLGISIYEKLPESWTNRLFLILAGLIDLYIIVNFLSLHPPSAAPEVQLFWIRVVMFVTSFIGPTLFLLVHTFPNSRVTLRWRYRIILGILMATSAVAALTPLVFSGIQYPNGEPVPTPGWGIGIFILDFVGLFILSFVVLIYKYHKAEGEEKARLFHLLAGVLASFSLMGLFTVLFVVIAKTSSFVFLGPILPVILIAFIAYAIVKHQLFDIKTFATQALVYTLWIILFAKIFAANTSSERLIDAGIFGSMLILGTFLVRSVHREVQQRETIEQQSHELEIVNQQQENLLHFISHEIKGYLTKGEGAFSEIVEGDYGDTPVEVKTLASRALLEMRKGVATVMDILNASNLRKGTVTYKKTSFDLKTEILVVIDAQKYAAEEKHLTFDVQLGDGTFIVEGDEAKMREHVVRNLIDNAVKYTPSGTIRVTLSDGNGKIRFVVEDNGVGITSEDMARLFTEGGHGKDSIKVNVHSTGYGLFIAKQIVEAHGGKIWAESEGAGKGSRFIVELPAA
jgi:signal transduction histidine kinase